MPLWVSREREREREAHGGSVPWAEGNASDDVLKIVADPTDDTPSYYCNFVETVCSPHEMALNFVRVPTKLTAAQTEEAKGGTLNLEPAVQVFFAPTLLPALVAL